MNYTLSPVLYTTLLSAVLAVLASQAGAAQEMQHHNHANHERMTETTAVSTTEDHSQHMQAIKSMNNHDYRRSVDDYALPALELLDMNGNKISLDEVLNIDQPMMVNFIYTSCTTICPILSATFSSAQQQMGTAAEPVKWVSISIDPEYDTPERLREYAQRFQAGANWQFITGGVEQIVALQKAFGVYFGSKANHKPVTLMRAGRNHQWVRLEGLTSGAELVAEYHRITH